MLILTRSVGQAIVIAHDITVTVAGIHPNKVNLAIDAPKSIPVRRGEVERKVQQEPNR